MRLAIVAILLAMARWLAAIVAFAWIPIAVAQSGGRISGTLTLTGVPDVLLSVSYSCVGQPTCTGTYTATFKDQPCSNSITYGGPFTLTGVDLSHPGTFQGSLTFGNDISDLDPAGNGVCTYNQNGPTSSLAYTGTWAGNGSGNVRITGTAESGFAFVLEGNYAATPAAPLFPMTVSSNITSTTANASAQIQFRPQDVGTSGSVFVFALAPRSLVRPALLKDDGDCVLAQVNSSGQLVAVSSSNMQPAVTGVLSAQGASVTLLNNVSTPAVAGSQVFVGYGPDAATMLSTGISQNAVGVPGATQCSPSLTKSAGALSGLFWNSGESGWGINFTQRGSNVFAAWYTYDGSGNPKWYVSTCAMGAGATPLSGTCSGQLFQVTGPTFFNRPFSSSAVVAAAAGNLQVTFQDANRGSMTYTLGSQTRTVALERQPFPPGATPPAIDHTDLWWNPDESGWGVALTQQFQIIFAAWYVYSDSGQPIWYVVPICAVNTAGNACSGSVYRTTGPAFGPTFNPASVQAIESGTASISFSDANNGTLSYTVNGVSGSKNITRQIF